MTSGDVKQLVWGAILLALAACVPLVANGYWMSIALTIAMFTVLSTSWALFSGPTHYISLATAAFFGVGGFLVGTGMSDYNTDYWTMVVIASLAGTVLAFLVGLATLRLSGVYFVIFTLGLAEMIRTLVSWIQNNFTGSRGLYVLTDLGEADIYIHLVLVAALVYLAGWWIARSRLGFAMRIIGNDEMVARHVGINTAFSKVILFTFSGFVASLVGALIAPRYTYIEPNGVFSPELSFIVVIMALLGGTGRLWGPIVGVIPFALLQEYINANYSNYSTLVLGIAFLVIVYFLPHGVLGRLEETWAKRRRSTW
ncbi:MAG: branched-chain amino acid ABC transporter permease [Alphaproteobacteria bacterium]|jgi:branched-chain amino acid transport system permease protein|nr:branched-chain amino acid ABC transporter permease [Alphaproteobacteria bacterium]